jgi:hypothetical protein
MTNGNGSQPLSSFWREFLSLVSSGLLIAIVGSGAVVWREIGVLSNRVDTLSRQLERVQSICLPDSTP